MEHNKFLYSYEEGIIQIYKNYQVSFTRSFITDWIAGSFGGVALTIAGHPFEYKYCV